MILRDESIPHDSCWSARAFGVNNATTTAPVVALRLAFGDATTSDLRPRLSHAVALRLRRQLSREATTGTSLGRKSKVDGP